MGSLCLPSIMTSSDTNSDASVAVQCTVPEYQRREWEQHAEDLDMSLSEFLRCMTQAGRNGFTDQSTASPTTPEQTSNTNAAIEFDLLSLIRENGPIDWDAVMTEIESTVEETLNNLQAEGSVVYSGKAGGYTVTEVS